MGEVQTQIIEAEYIRDYGKSTLYNCEGDDVWFPTSQVTFNAEKNELTVPTWLLRKKFPNENF